MTGQMVIYQMNQWMIEMNIVLDIRGQVSQMIGTQGFKRQDMGAKNHVMVTHHVLGITLFSGQKIDTWGINLYL